jgi:hypothetical protein
VNCNDLVAIDIYTHAEISCRHPEDEAGRAFDEAAERYFGSSHRPTMDETVDYYLGRRIGLVMFSVDADFQTDRQRISNEDVAATAPPIPLPITMTMTSEVVLIKPSSTAHMCKFIMPQGIALADRLKQRRKRERNTRTG